MDLLQKIDGLQSPTEDRIILADLLAWCPKSKSCNWRPIRLP